MQLQAPVCVYALRSVPDALTPPSSLSLSLSLSRLCRRDMTALDLARLRRGVAEPEDQERFDAIATLLIRFIEAPAKFAVNEKMQPGGQTQGGGFFAAVGTFFFGAKRDVRQVL